MDTWFEVLGQAVRSFWSLQFCFGWVAETLSSRRSTPRLGSDWYLIIHLCPSMTVVEKVYGRVEHNNNPHTEAKLVFSQFSVDRSALRCLMFRNHFWGKSKDYEVSVNKVWDVKGSGREPKRRGGGGKNLGVVTTGH